MKLLTVELTNFGSYKELQFNYENQGLSLIYGNTGAGKSTLQDAALWCLFGTTAKNGNADDVRSWNAETPTVVTLNLVTASAEQLTVRRTRGTPSQNDLYFHDVGEEPTRGKDITDTQKLLEARLVVSKDLYIAGAYYNEFSSTGAFFTAKAKDRRELLECITDLSLPIKLAERSSNEKKEVKKSILKLSERVNQVRGNLQQLKRTQVQVEKESITWQAKQDILVETVRKKRLTFEADKQAKLITLLQDSKTWQDGMDAKKQSLEQQLAPLETDIHNQSTCGECGQTKLAPKSIRDQWHALSAELKTLESKVNPYTRDIESLESQVNNYDALLEVEMNRENPFLSQLAKINKELPNTEEKLQKLESELADLNHRVLSLGQIYDLSFLLRGKLLSASISAVESDTNRYLERYFDSPLRVSFDATDGDNLEVNIYKDGHECSYKQLSKGQRGLLKLCFSVAVMRAASNQAGVHFDTLFFDEALDGLDGELKVKAFNLFSDISTRHGTVLLIDHAEAFQSLFYKKFHVIIDGDTSEITEE